MRPDWRIVEALFDEALDLEGAARAAFLRERCAGRPELEAELRALLAASDADSGFMEQPPRLGSGAPTEGSSTVAPGLRCGVWAVRRLIGRGGMGEVYEVERADGLFEQRAALKLIRADSGDTWQRFQAERQILARLEHPGIARLLDGGVALDGRAYMVMEYVDGRSLTEFAGGRPLSERLELFIQVCDAVAYAHRNLVIHRDIKPSNICVDQDARVKLLDFGVAKLQSLGGDPDSQLTQTLVMTPDYAAPETLRGDSVSTAVDVYALGAVLYELLVGQPAWMLRSLPLSVAVERLLHAEPPMPSTAAASSPTAVPARLLRGDLDAIVAKCLRKLPESRYATVDALRADVERHMAGSTVLARGGVRSYRAGVFLRRYRWLVAAVGGIVLALAAGLAGTAWQAHRAAVERDVARREVERGEAVQRFVEHLFRTVDRADGTGELTARMVLDRAAQRLMDLYSEAPDQAVSMLYSFGYMYLVLNDYEAADPLLSRVVEEPPADIDPALQAQARYELADLRYRQRREAESARLLTQARAFWAEDPARYRSERISAMLLESQLARAAGDVDTAIARLQAMADERLAGGEPDHPDIANAYATMAVVYMSANQPQAGLAACRKAWAAHERIGDTGSTAALNTLNNWASLAFLAGDLDESARRFEQALILRRRLYGPSAATAALASNYAKILIRLDRLDEAAPLLDEASAMALEYAGENSPEYSATLGGAVELALAAHDAPAAEAASQRATSITREHFGGSSVQYAVSLMLQARVQEMRGDAAAAKATLDQVEAVLEPYGAAAQRYREMAKQVRSRLN